MVYRVTSFAGFIALVLVSLAGRTYGQQGRVFNITEDTVGIWEMNVSGDLGTPLPDGTVIPDRSGNGRDAVVVANGGNTLAVGLGDENPDRGPSTSVERVGGGDASRLEVGDPTAFEMGADQDFSVELYVRRAETVGGEGWGILAGTWHSRDLLDDATCLAGDTNCINANGAWHGFGFILNPDQGWSFVSSPINPDGTFNPSFNEVLTPFFPMNDPGMYYLVATVDRVNGMATVYVNGLPVGSVGIPVGQVYRAPTGYARAPFMFLNGQDDPSRGVYRRPPTGFSIDAARVLKRALPPEEIEENYLIIGDGVPVPPSDSTIQAILAASPTTAVVDQCIRLSGEESDPGEGETVTQYEWQIGAAPFEVGDAVREISFSAPTDPAGVEVSLRITNSATQTSTATVTLVVNPLEAPVAEFTASIDGSAVGGDPTVVPRGSVLALDATGSFTPVPGSAITCPLVDAIPVPAPAIAEYRWDFDGDGTADATGVTTDLGPLELGELTIELTVENELGLEGTVTRDILVVEPTNNSRVFHETPDSLLILEMNDLPVAPGEILPTGTVIPDLSGNDFDGVVEANDGGEILAEDGNPVYQDNGAATRAFGGTSRIAVNEGGFFEFDEFQDFSLELYVRRAEVVGGEAWGMLAGTWHSRDLVIDDICDADPNPDTCIINSGAWYGYGIILNPDVGWRLMMSPINPDGTFTPGFNEVQTPARFIPPGSHYLAATIDRATGQGSYYMDGELVGSVAITAGLAFIAPLDYPVAPFMVLNGEDDRSRGVYRVPPSGYAVDAVRVQTVSLTAEEIAENWENILNGRGADPGAGPEGVGPFVRGDCDQDGTVNLTDGIFLLNFLFLGGSSPVCPAACDNNQDGRLDITTAVYLFNFLFLGGPVPPAPTGACGTSTAPTDEAQGCPDPQGCA